MVATISLVEEIIALFRDMEYSVNRIAAETGIKHHLIYQIIRKKFTHPVEIEYTTQLLNQFRKAIINSGSNNAKTRTFLNLMDQADIPIGPAKKLNKLKVHHIHGLIKPQGDQWWYWLISKDVNSLPKNGNNRQIRHKVRYATFYTRGDCYVVVIYPIKKEKITNIKKKYKIRILKRNMIRGHGTKQKIGNAFRERKKGIVKCKIKNCNNRFIAKGFCSYHYYQDYARRTKPRKPRDWTTTCSVSGSGWKCTRASAKNSMCHTHKYAKNHGIPFYQLKEYSCTIKGCYLPYLGAGLCRKHKYERDNKRAKERRRKKIMENSFNTEQKSQ